VERKQEQRQNHQTRGQPMGKAYTFVTAMPKGATSSRRASTTARRANLVLE
jgi:hypothetical protein